MKSAWLLVFLLIVSSAFATMDAGELAAARQLISSNTSCDKLNASQLELIGDYYMEQMHPGQAHEAMDRMMGGEGSDSLGQAHTQIALVLYCGRTNTSATYGGMMGMMPFMYQGGLGGGMTGYPYGGMMGYGMMGNGGWGWIAGLLFLVLAFIALILAIFWLYRSITGAGRALSAPEILGQRYARGEITKKQFEEMKKDLE